MPKIKHLKVNGLVMQDLKQFKFKKLFKHTLALSLLVLSLNANAAWHKASGVGTSRNDAVNDAVFRRRRRSRTGSAVFKARDQRGNDILNAQRADFLGDLGARSVKPMGT